MLKFATQVMAAGCLMLVAACSDEPGTGPEEDLGTPGVRIISGANVTDTASYRIPAPLVVEVRDDEGRLARGTWVVFEVQPPVEASRRSESPLVICARPFTQCSFDNNPVGGSFATARSDSAGRVTAFVQLGRVAGRAVVRIYAPEFGKPDSVSYQVLPGPAYEIRMVTSDTVLEIGTTANLRARSIDRFNNTRAETPAMTLSAGNAVTLDAANGVVTARELGTQWLVARQGTFADSTRVRSVPAGRLVMWSPSSETVRMVDVSGANTRTIMSFVKASPGTMPVFSASRQRVSFRHGYYDNCCSANSVVTIDTTGLARRDVDPTFGFQPLATRQMADGSVLIIGTRNGSSTAGLWRFATDSSITLLATLPGGVFSFGAADISHDGTRIAYSVGQNTRLELRIFTVATNSFTVLEPNATSPRWSRSDDRIAFLVPVNGMTGPIGTSGNPGIANADGSGRRVFTNTVWQLGIGWSPDGQYLIGRKSSFTERELQVLRSSDGVFVSLTFRDPVSRNIEDYQQPDWR